MYCRCIYWHYMNLTFSPYKLHMSNAYIWRASTHVHMQESYPRCLHLFVDSTLSRILIGVWCSSLAPAQITAVPSPITSSPAFIYRRRCTTSALSLASSCLGSAHFAHVIVTTMSSISWQFLRSIYADRSAAPLLGGVAISEAHEDFHVDAFRRRECMWLSACSSAGCSTISAILSSWIIKKDTRRCFSSGAPGACLSSASWGTE